MVNRVRRALSIPEGSGETAGFAVHNATGVLAVDFGPTSAGAADHQIVAAEGIQSIQSKRQRFTVAEINAGATLLAAKAGYKYRLIDWQLIAIGGNAGGADDVRILGTRSGAVVLFDAEVAALTRSTVVRPGSANTAVLADGASHTALDVNTAVTVGKTGGALATATHVDFIVSFVIEKA